MIDYTKVPVLGPMVQNDTRFNAIVLKTLPEGVNHWTRRNMQMIEAVVYHITASEDIQSVDAWFNDPLAMASAHFAIDKDGSIHQYVSTLDTAWSNGNINKPNGDWIPWLQRCLATDTNPNYKTISIEHVGFPDQQITEAQFLSSVKLSSYLLPKYSIKAKRENLCRHSDFDTVTRPNCPGDLFPLAEIIAALARLGY